MQMTIRKVVNGVIDFDRERLRIKKAFRKDKSTRDHLNRLMDLIEAQKWQQAEKELQKKWWKGRDKRLECPRGEFIGVVDFIKNEGFDVWGNYADLVYAFVRRPETYQVVSTESAVK